MQIVKGGCPTHSEGSRLPAQPEIDTVYGGSHPASAYTLAITSPMPKSIFSILILHLQSSVEHSVDPFRP